MPHCLLCTENKPRLVVLHAPTAEAMAQLQVRGTISVHSACEACAARMAPVCPWCRYDLTGQQAAAVLEAQDRRCGQAVAVKVSQSSLQYRFCTIAPGENEFCHMHRGVLVAPGGDEAGPAAGAAAVQVSHIGGMPLSFLQAVRTVYDGVGASVSSVMQHGDDLAQAGAQAQVALHDMSNRLVTDANQFRVLTAMTNGAPLRVQNATWPGMPAIAAQQSATVVELTDAEVQAEAAALVAQWA